MALEVGVDVMVLGSIQGDDTGIWISISLKYVHARSSCQTGWVVIESSSVLIFQ